VTVSLSVADLLRAPASYQHGRVVVTGVLYLDEELAFRIFQSAEGGYDHRVVVEIDDPEAVAKVRAALVDAGRAPEYLGPGVVDGRGRPMDRGLVVEDILTVYVGDPLQRRSSVLVVDVRPNPSAR
jgi:hypothetical protein